MWKKIKPYVISIIIALGVGGLSALFTRGSMDIYNEIQKPPLSPPGSIFPVVWGILYTLMGISAAIVYIKSNKSPSIYSNGLNVYAMSLAVNFLWSILFFNLKAFLISFIWIMLLWFMIIATIVRYYSVSKAAAYLQIPYFLWVTFAAYLNLMIFILN